MCCCEFSYQRFGKRPVIKDDLYSVRIFDALESETTKHMASIRSRGRFLASSRDGPRNGKKFFI